MANLTGKVVRTIHTAPAEGQAQKPTVLTVDFEGVTPEAAMAYMFSTIAIRMQSRWRGKKSGGIPAEQTVKVTELLNGTRAAPVTVDSTKAAFHALSPEQQAELLKAFQAEMAEKAKADKAKK